MGGQRRRDLVGLVGEATVQVLAVPVELRLDLAVVVVEKRRQRCAGRFKGALRCDRPIADEFGDLFGHAVHRLVQGVALDRNHVVEAVACLGQARGQTITLGYDRARDARAGLVEPSHDGFPGAGKPALKILRLADQGLTHRVRRAGEPLNQVATTRADIQGAGLADMDERRADFLPLDTQRARHPVARLADCRDQSLGHPVEVARKALVRAGNRPAHLVSIREDRLALRGEFIDERAHAAFVLAVGPFEVRHFGADESLELAGARQSALDAVAHGSDFAADRLRQRHHLLGGDRLRLGEAHRHLHHGARGQPHLLCAAREGGRHEEKQKRPDDGEQHQRRARLQQAAVGEVGAVGVEIEDTDKDPGNGGEARHNHRRAARLGLHGAQDLSHGLAIVVCGAGVGRYRRPILQGHRPRGGGPRSPAAWLREQGIVVDIGKLGPVRAIAPLRLAEGLGRGVDCGAVIELGLDAAGFLRARLRSPRFGLSRRTLGRSGGFFDVG